MFEELRITNLNRADLSPLSLSLFDQREYKIKYIDGLNPPPATIVTSEYAFIEGSRFQNAKSEPRNIVMTLGFSPSFADDLDYTALRRGLYPYLMPKANVQLDFQLYSGKTYTIEGYVETHESSIFTKDPLSQISIVCPDPYFEDRDESNEIYMPFDEQPGRIYYDIDVFYEGDVPNGLTLLIQGLGSSYQWTHQLIHGSELQSLIVKEGARQVFNTEFRTTPGSKNVIFGSTPAFDSIDIRSDWLMLYPGENRIYGSLHSGEPKPAGDVTVRWVNLYGGL